MSVGSTDGFALLNDLPVALPNEDLLGIDAAAEGIAKALRASAESSPFVVAVDAEWGMGKSTLLQMVRAKLDPAHAKREDAEDRPFRTVWFNAWTAEGDNALAGLIKSVLVELDPNIVRRALRSVAKRKRLMGVAGISLTVAARFLGVNRLVDELWTRLYLDVQSRNRLRGEIADMLEEWTGRSPEHTKRRIVIFIDDLDRCTDDVVVQVCEAVKLYLDVPGLIFVLACDQSVLARSVQDPARGGLGEARSYLEKIIQVQYRLPSPDDEAIENLIEGYARASKVPGLLKEEVRTALVKGCGRNPRRIKRIINSFILEYQLSPAWQNAPLSSYYLLIAILLQHLYKPFYDFIIVGDQFDDPITEFLGYAEHRGTLDELRRQPQEHGPERAAPPLHELKKFLAERGVHPSQAEESDPDHLISLLDEKFPEIFAKLVDNRRFVALLGSIGVEIREPFLKQLRFHPLVTQSPQQLPLRDYGTNRGRARSVTIIHQHQLIPDGAPMTLELETLVKSDVAQQVSGWMAENPVRAQVWWSSHPSRPLRWAVEPDKEWNPTSLRDEIFRRAGISAPSFSAADAWCYEGESLYVIANSAFESP